MTEPGNRGFQAGSFTFAKSRLAAESGLTRLLPKVTSEAVGVGGGGVNWSVGTWTGSLSSAVVPFYQLFGEGSPTKIGFSTGWFAMGTRGAQWVASFFQLFFGKDSPRPPTTKGCPFFPMATGHLRVLGCSIRQVSGLPTHQQG